MLYLDYEQTKYIYLSAESKYNDLLDEKEKLFDLTQPKSTRYDSDRVNGGRQDNAFERYMIKKEQLHLDERIEEAKEILKERETLLNLKREQLRASKEIIDVIYVMRHIDHKKVSKIARKVNYSKSQVYRIIEKIDKDIKMRQFATSSELK